MEERVSWEIAEALSRKGRQSILRERERDREKGEMGRGEGEGGAKRPLPSSAPSAFPLLLAVWLARCLFSYRPPLAHSLGTLRSRSCETWSWMSDKRGETTTVTPGVRRAGSW